jgi:Ca2+/H+ antiporter, TMEM165/GDT1 family
VVVIVIGIGAAGGMLVPASIGAIAACALVIAVGGILHKPLARVPENQLKYVVGLIMTAFGLFWFGEGIGIEWPWGDGAIVALIAALTLVSFAVTRLARALSRTLEGAS